MKTHILLKSGSWTECEYLLDLNRTRRKKIRYLFDVKWVIKILQVIWKKSGNIIEQEEKYMDEYIKEISEKIDSKKEYYAKISNRIWEFAEPRLQEYKSSELLRQSLKEEGFLVRSNLAGEETAFIAEYGSGKPVIGFLGEFDALPGLSQKADATERIPAEPTQNLKGESEPERETK